MLRHSRRTSGWTFRPFGDRRSVSRRVAPLRIGALLSAGLLATAVACRPEEYAEASTDSVPAPSLARASTSVSTPVDGTTPVEVRLTEWKLVPSRLTVPTGAVLFTITNSGTMSHAFEVEGQGVEKEIEPLKAGETGTIRVTLPPGTYELYCPVDAGAHKKMGMIAHLEVLGEVDMKSLIHGLQGGGFVIVMRHAPTNRDQSDSNPLNYDDTTHQRRLSSSGRDLAAQTGKAYRSLGIPIGAVYTSMYSRAVETGKLVGNGEVSRTPDVTEGGLVATPAENDRRAAALKRMAATVPRAGTNTLIVTHRPNLVDAFGDAWLSSKDGEASVFKPDGSGALIPVARVQMAAWIKAAAEK